LFLILVFQKNIKEEVDNKRL